MPLPHARDSRRISWNYIGGKHVCCPPHIFRRCRSVAAAAAAPLPLRLTSLSRAATRVLKRDIALCNKQAYGFTTKSSSVFILYCALIFGCVDR
jgi:hypothetical protein